MMKCNSINMDTKTAIPHPQRYQYMLSLRHTILFSLAFVLCVPLGTISHEYGHIAVAETLGYDTQLHFDRMSYDMSSLNAPISELLALQRDGSNFSSEQEARLYQLHHSRKSHMKWITLGGILQTLLFGSIALIVLYSRRKTHIKSGLQVIDWIAVFLALFWSRQIFNPVMSILSELTHPNGHWFGGDEYKLAYLMNLWDGTFSIPLGLMGLLVCTYIVFKVVPVKYRYSFICSALIGSASGYILWMYLIGPLLLPR